MHLVNICTKIKKTNDKGEKMKKKIIVLFFTMSMIGVACSNNTTENRQKETRQNETTQDETSTARDDFESQAISAILASQHVKESTEISGLSDVNVEITNKRVDGYSAAVKCIVTYSDDYIEATEALQCSLEEWSEGWLVEDVEVESSQQGTPIKFPDKVNFAKVDTFDGEEWVISADCVVTDGNDSNLITIDETYNIKEVIWNTSEISDDFTSGVVTIDIICEDSKDNGTVTGELNFEHIRGKWSLSIDKKIGDIVAIMERPTLEDYGSGEIEIWVDDSAVDITKKYAEAFLTSNPQYSGYTVKVESVGVGFAANGMITDPEYGADIYNFLNDQLVSLVNAGALCDITGTYYAQSVTRNNDSGSVNAAQIGESIYAFPLTCDNGYFLYYDKSVITDPTSLEVIVADCEKAGKKFCFQMNNGWYNQAFFFGTGCELTYNVDLEGKFSTCNISHNSEKGLVALKEMIELANSPAYTNTSEFNVENIGAIVTGTWNRSKAIDMFGSNCGACRLPEFIGCDGNTYQLSGFSGNKLWGVKPQTSEGKAIVCQNLAEYLSSAEVQLAYYEELFWCPSNLEVLQNYKVKSDQYVYAMIEHNKYAVPLGLYPSGVWNEAYYLGQDVVDGVYSIYTADSLLKDALAEFEETCITYTE